MRNRLQRAAFVPLKRCRADLLALGAAEESKGHLYFRDTDVEIENFRAWCAAAPDDTTEDDLMRAFRTVNPLHLGMAVGVLMHYTDEA